MLLFLFISLSLLIEIPVNNSASVSFGIIISVNSKSDLGNSIAGAGFNTVVIFCLRAILNACSIASNGTSSCATTKSAPINALHSSQHQLHLMSYSHHRKQELYFVLLHQQ